MSAASLAPSARAVAQVEVIDSHTGGEPTRLVMAGGPDLGDGPLSVRRAMFARDHDAFRRAVVCEPRGSDVLVGALLVEPHDPTCTLGVIFFNNSGMLGMCGHGTIGLVASLAAAGRITAGEHRIDTPVGPVSATLAPDGTITVRNVPAYRHLAGVSVEVEGLGHVTGDVAWGGNWFFLARDYAGAVVPSRMRDLTRDAVAIRDALVRHGITGADGAEIDHIELFGPGSEPGRDSRSFVLCPGDAYDRSPCGTGTSAKLACLAADGKLAPGVVWHQESVIGSVFAASYEMDGNRLIPSIRSRAHVTARATLLLDPSDPFCWGIDTAA